MVMSVQGAAVGSKGMSFRKDGFTGTELMFLDYTNPSLDIKGNLDVTGATTITNLIATAGGETFSINADSAGLYFGGGTAGADVRILSAGNTAITLDSSQNATFADDVRVNGLFRYADMSEVTIAAGAVTVTQNLHYIDTEGDAATDDLNTINGGVEGMMLICRVAVGGRDVVFKNGTGNIFMGDSADVTLSTTSDNIMLCYYAGAWHVLSSLV